jgi:hypothetical protein
MLATAQQQVGWRAVAQVRSAEGWLMAYVYGSVAFSWVVNLLMCARPKH